MKKKLQTFAKQIFPDFFPEKLDLKLSLKPNLISSGNFVSSAARKNHVDKMKKENLTEKTMTNMKMQKSR
jgi:hypothetical protein